MQSGQEVISAVLALGTNAHDAPRQPVTITASGLTNAKGAIPRSSLAICCWNTALNIS